MLSSHKPKTSLKAMLLVPCAEQPAGRAADLGALVLHALGLGALAPQVCAIAREVCAALLVLAVACPIAGTLLPAGPLLVRPADPEEEMK